MRPNVKIAAHLLAIILVIPFFGCKALHYKKSADKEVYKIIKQKGKTVGEMPSHFEIADATQEEVTQESIPDPLPLIDAIEIAVAHSREYQSRKETLYLQALSLTSSRHTFDPLFSGNLGGDVARSADERNSISGGLSQGVKKMLATGADLSLDITTNAFRYISGGASAESAGTAITASVVQPLLQGAGKAVTLENLTQAERDMIYSLRDFVHYRKSFSVDIARRYYKLLQGADQVNNASRSYENLRFLRGRANSLAEAGRVAAFEVDQASQRELQARDTWIRAVESYQGNLDDFKVFMGIPADAIIRPSTQELEKIRDQGILPVETDEEGAVARSLECRLDLKSQREKVVDAARKVKVSESDLKPRLDLILNAGTSTTDNQPLDFNRGADTYAAGLDFDFPYDKKSERNSYRRSLINLNATGRDFVKKVDQIKVEVRNAFRTLSQSRQSFEIQTKSLLLAQQRWESTQILQQAGRAVTRDVLEAQRDLNDATNALTRALIDHLTARLDLFLAMENLRIDDQGLWAELLAEPTTPTTNPGSNP